MSPLYPIHSAHQNPPIRIPNCKIHLLLLTVQLPITSWSCAPRFQVPHCLQSERGHLGGKQIGKYPRHENASVVLKTGISLTPIPSLYSSTLLGAVAEPAAATAGKFSHCSTWVSITPEGGKQAIKNTVSALPEDSPQLPVWACCQFSPCCTPASQLFP